MANGNGIRVKVIASVVAAVLTAIVVLGATRWNQVETNTKGIDQNGKAIEEVKGETATGFRDLRQDLKELRVEQREDMKEVRAAQSEILKEIRDR